LYVERECKIITVQVFGVCKMTSLRRRQAHTRPGDQLHVESQVLEVMPLRSRPDRGMVVMRGETRNHRGEVVQIFTGKLVVPRRSVTTEGLSVE
jgi:hypothetical protein